MQKPAAAEKRQIWEKTQQILTYSCTLSIEFDFKGWVADILSVRQHGEPLYIYQSASCYQQIHNKYSQSGQRPRDIQPGTPWPAGSWSGTSSAASPSQSFPPQRPATGELCPQVNHSTALHCLPGWAEFALSYRSCGLRHTLYGSVVCVHSAEERSWKTSPCLNHSRHDEKCSSEQARLWFLLLWSQLGGVGSDCCSALIGCCISSSSVKQRLQLRISFLIAEWLKY